MMHFTLFFYELLKMFLGKFCLTDLENKWLDILSKYVFNGTKINSKYY